MIEFQNPEKRVRLSELFKLLLMLKLTSLWVLVLFSFAANCQYLTNQSYLLGFGDLNQVSVPYEPSKSVVDGDYLYHVTYSNGDVLGNYLLIKKHHVDGTPSWEATHGNIGPMTQNHGVDLKVDGSGNVYVIGATKHTTEGYNALLLKYNSSGMKQWEYNYHSMGSNDDVATALDIDGSGNCYITGQTGSGSAADLFVLKVDQNGTFSWLSTYDYDGMAEGGIWIEHVSATSVDVLAITQDDAEDFQLSRLNFNGTGVLQTAHRSTIGYGGMQIHDLIKDGTNYIVCGAVMNTNGDWDMAAYKLSSTMAATWSYIHDEAGEDDCAYAIVKDGSGNIYCGGQVSDGIPFFRVAKLSSLGIEQEEHLGDNYPNSSVKDVQVIGNKLLSAIGIEATKNQMLCTLFDNTLQPEWENKLAPATYGVVPLWCQPLTATSFVYVSLKESINTTFEVRRFDLFDEGLTVEDDADGNHIVQNQVAVQLWADLINTDFTDNENLEFAWLSEVVTPPTFTWLKDSVDTIPWDSIRCRKIFPSFKSTDVSAVGNHNYSVDLPKLYSNVMLYFNEDIDEEATATALDGLDNIFVFAEVDEVPVLAGWTPNDPKLTSQANLVPTTSFSDLHINMEEAWEIEKGEEFVRLGIFDTGILWYHEDFSKDGSRDQDKSKVVAGYSLSEKKDFFDLKPHQVDIAHPTHGYAHGTRMAGISASITNNNKGVAGVAGGDASKGNYGISLVAFQSDLYGSGTTPKSRIAEYMAIGVGDDPLKHHIANHSWSTTKKSKVLIQGVYTAYLLGTIQAAASANDYKEKKVYPSGYDDDMVMRIGCTDNTNERANFSNYGFNLDFMAPGVTGVHTGPDVMNDSS